MRQIFPFSEEILQFPSFYGKGHFTLSGKSSQIGSLGIDFCRNLPYTFIKRLFYFGGKYADCNFYRNLSAADQRRCYTYQNLKGRTGGAGSHSADCHCRLEGTHPLPQGQRAALSGTQPQAHLQPGPRLSGQPHTLKVSAGISSRHYPCTQRIQHWTQRYGNRQNPQGAAGVHPAHHVR